MNYVMFFSRFGLCDKIHVNDHSWINDYRIQNTKIVAAINIADIGYTYIASKCEKFPGTKWSIHSFEREDVVIGNKAFITRRFCKCKCLNLIFTSVNYNILRFRTGGLSYTI